MRLPLLLSALVALLVSACGADPCEKDNGGCDANASCMAHKSVVTCTCDAAHGFMGDGKSCHQDPCLTDNGGCGDPMLAGTCTSTNGVAACQCFPGSTLTNNTCVPETISVAATDNSLSLAYDVTISGQSTGAFSSIQITGGVGTIEVSGATLPALAYEQIPFPAANNEILYQILAVANDRWIVAWAYCSSTSLTYVWYEATDGTMGTSESATGTCTATTATEDPMVQFPAVQMPFPTLIPGFSMTGTDLTYDGMNPGSMTLSQSTWTVYPFTTVDCSTGCGTPGWYELHSVLWQPSTAQACYGIYYLTLNDANRVTLDYVICLPGLTDPVGKGASLTATYTHP